MNMKMKRLLIALLSASVAASASAVADNQKALQAKADSANPCCSTALQFLYG